MDNDFLSLTSLTHLDGRNRQKLTGLGDYFSEFSWMKTRILVLLKWLEFLSKKKIIKNLGKSPAELTRIYENFSPEENNFSDSALKFEIEKNFNN